MYKQLPGFRCVLPVIPFSKHSAEIIDFIYDLSSAYHQEAVTSIFGLDSYSLEVFVRIFILTEKTKLK